MMMSKFKYISGLCGKLTDIALKRSNLNAERLWLWRILWSAGHPFACPESRFSILGAIIGANRIVFAYGQSHVELAVLISSKGQHPISVSPCRPGQLV